MTENLFNRQLTRIDRDIARIKQRSQWITSVRTAVWDVDNTYDAVSHPGNSTSALIYILLDPGRWTVFGNARIHSTSAMSTYTALRLVGDPAWDNTADPDDDLDYDLRNSTTFLTLPSANPKVYASFIIEEDRTYVQLGITKVSGSADVNISAANLIAIPG